MLTPDPTGVPPVATQQPSAKADMTDPAAHLGESGLPPGVWDALTWLARREGFAVGRADCGTAQSQTTWHSRRIVVQPGLDPQLAVRALLHELGHVLAHADLVQVPGATSAGCSGIRKVEADSIAFIVAARLRMDTFFLSWPYTASWAGTDPRAQPELAIQAAMDRITRAATTITAHLDVALFCAPPQRAGIVPVPAPQPTQDAAATGERAAAPRELVSRSRPGAAVVPAGIETSRRADPIMVLRVLTDAETFYLGHLSDSWAPAYLADRGLERHVIKQWRVGYAPGAWTALTGHLRRLGYDDALIQAAGLARFSSRGTLIDHFRDRIMLGVRDERGMIVGFIGRACPDAGSAVPKYLNSPETSTYHKGNLLFGLAEARDQFAQGAIPVIVEGPFDAIAVTTADRHRYAGLAPCGTALTSRQLDALASVTDLAQAGVLMALDGDRAGHDGIVRAYELLIPYTGKTMAAILPTGRDPADILRTSGPTALRTVLDRSEPLAQAVIDVHLDRWESRIDHADGRLVAMRSAAELIARTLPPGTADEVRQLTGGRRLEILDENLHHVSHAELSVIARVLPPNAACQIVRVADRTGCASYEVTAEVTNAVLRSLGPEEHDAARALRARARSLVAQPERLGVPRLARASFPGPSVPGSLRGARSPPEPRRAATRFESVKKAHTRGPV
ncbi:MAG TPA: toprim domain-containing protein [Streptosporangiaceae bacterium]|nr:toprim domain-containing protein [Streptosporangiaceae bacterium]